MSQLSFSSFDDALLVRDAQGRFLPASVDQILEAARQAIELKMQRGVTHFLALNSTSIQP